jgi:hypothetical protein
MLQAILRGKLTRAEEGLEDLLTSNTFGLLKYLPPEAALLPFLGRAIDPLTQTPLADRLTGLVRVDRWEFWPTLTFPGCTPCEPDVLLVLSDGRGRRVGVLVEAKFRSGKSSVARLDQVAPHDQLARELDNLRAFAQDERLAAFAVLYLTPAVACPEADIRRDPPDGQP